MLVIILAKVSIRGTLLKLRLELLIFMINLSRHGTYLQLLPTPIHDLKVTRQSLNDDISRRYLDADDVGKTAVWAKFSTPTY